MRKSFVAVVTAGLMLLGPAALAAPSNDARADAQEVSAFPFAATEDTTTATAEPGEPMPSCADTGATVWYTLSGAGARVNIDTIGSDYDTTLTVYRVTEGDGLTEVACNDDIDLDQDDLRSEVNVALAEGQRYVIQAGGFNGDSGALTITFGGTGGGGGGSTPHDDFADAADVTSLPATVEIDTTDATFESGEPQACGISHASVWIRYTPAEDVGFQVDGANSGYPVLTGLYTGTSFEDLSVVTCGGGFVVEEPFAPNSHDTTLSAILRAGTTYHLQAGGGYAEDRGLLSLHLATIDLVDVAVTELEVRKVPLQTDMGPLPGGMRHDITVTYGSLDGATDEIVFDLYACTTVTCSYIGSDFRAFGDGELVTETFTWSGRGTAGDVSIVAGIYPGSQLDPNGDNNARRASTFIGVGGTGFGASACAGLIPFGSLVCG